MAIDTATEKLAILELEDIWEPGLPLSPGALGQDDQQQLLWGFPGVLWATAAPPVHAQTQLVATYVRTTAVIGTYMPSTPVTATYVPSTDVIGTVED